MGQLYELVPAIGLYFSSEITAGHFKNMQVEDTFFRPILVPTPWHGRRSNNLKGKGQIIWFMVSCVQGRDKSRPYVWMYAVPHSRWEPKKH